MTMTRSRKIWITVGAALVLVFVVLPAVVYVAARNSCLPAPEDEHHQLVFESQMAVDVTIMNQELNEDSEQLYQETLGTVPAGQTQELTVFIPLPEVKSWDRLRETDVTTLRLKAKDPAGNVVWQKSWSKDEFHDLRHQGWTIVISPETDEE